MPSLSKSTLPLASCVVLTVAAAFGCSNSDSDSGPSIGFTQTGGITGNGGASAAGNGQTSLGGSGTAIGSGGGGSNPITVPISNAGNAGIEKCVGTTSTASPLPPVLEFLIDTSGSMNEYPGVMMGMGMGMMAPPGAVTKWVSTRDALIQAFTDMAEGTGAGLIYYPNVPDRGGAMCINRQVAVPLGLVDMTQRQRILMSLQTRGAPSGHTPTHDAYQFALQTVEASTLQGSKYVVLVTDGSPTYLLGCVGDGTASVDAAPIVAEAATALAQGIKTFVIGSPGSEDARASLSQMATQGGTALAGCSDAGPNYCHFDMTTAPDLSAALNAAFQAITGQVVSCAYTIPLPSGNNEIDITKVNVNFTNGAGASTPIPRDPSMTDCTTGWQFSPGNKQILLCPDACAQVRNDMGSKVDIELGCNTISR